MTDRSISVVLMWFILLLILVSVSALLFTLCADYISFSEDSRVATF